MFDLARDLDLHQRSMAQTGERAVAGRTTGLMEQGETVTWEARHFGLRWHLTSRMTELERPVRFVDEQVRGPFRSFRHEHTFEAAPPGTVMIDDWQHEVPFGLVGKIADCLVLGRYMQRLLITRNAVIKHEAERVATRPD